MWAGYMALANQQALANGNAALGFINPTIYPMGLGSGYATDFHDITSGNNGFPAVTGYDLDTGWGSPNGSGLINALAGTSSAPNFTISASPTSVSVVQGSNGTSTITTAVSGGFNSAVALSATGQPTGVTVSFNPTSIAAPGSGTSTMTMAVASTTATGTYTITVTGTGGGVTQTTTVNLTVTAPASANFTISASPTAITVVRGSSGTSTITTAALNGFNSAHYLVCDWPALRRDCELQSHVYPRAGLRDIDYEGHNDLACQHRNPHHHHKGHGRRHNAHDDSRSHRPEIVTA